MVSIPHWIYGLAGCYGVIGVIVFRLARKPSCRTCLNRGDCPNRVTGLASATAVPKCVRRSKPEAETHS